MSFMPSTASASTIVTWDRRHLLELEGLSAADLTGLLDRAQSLLPIATGEAPRLSTLANRTIANYFMEDSTRTRCSFTLAAVPPATPKASTSPVGNST